MLLPTASIRDCSASIPLTPACKALIIFFLCTYACTSIGHCCDRSSFYFVFPQGALKDCLYLIQGHVVPVDPQQRRRGAETQPTHLSLRRRPVSIGVLDVAPDQRERSQLLFVGGHLADLGGELVRGLQRREL